MPKGTDFVYPHKAHPHAYDGMNLRTYLAGQAMVGYLSTNDADDYTAIGIAEMSVKAADALIEELNNDRTNPGIS